jgi:hypothetical protein
MMPVASVVDVMLGDYDQPASVTIASDLHVQLSSFAIISCRSSTSDGLATAWRSRPGGEYREAGG